MSDVMDGEMIEEQAEARPSGDEALLVRRMEDGLRDLFTLCSGAGIAQRRKEAADLRLAYWEGQTPDGKKHPEDRPKNKVFPFEGSSDARIMLVDEVVLEKASLLTLAFWSADIQTSAFSLEDMAESARITALLKWIRNRSQRSELSEQILYLGNVVEGDDPGVAAVGVCWQQDLAIERVTLDRATVEQLGAALAESAGMLPGELLDEAFEDMVLPALLKQYEYLKEDAAMAALKELRETGQTELALPVVTRAYPKIKVYRLWEDLWMDPYCDRIADSPFVFERERLYEHQLRQRVVTLDWDEDWVEEVLAKGAGEFMEMPEESEGLAKLDGETRELWEKRGVYEIWRCYEKRSELYTGLPEVWETVFSPCVPDKVGLEAPQEYAHGEYRFSQVRREKLDYGLIESRGVGRVIGTHQAELKTLRDTRNDFAQLFTVPPYLQKKRAGAVDYVLSPGGGLKTERLDDFSWLTPPNGVGFHTSGNMESAVRADVDRALGRPSADGSPRAATVEQVMVTHYLSSLCPVFMQAAQLCLQYMEPAELADIVGPMAEGEKLDPRGLLDLSIEFDTRNLDMEFLKSKMGLIKDYVLSLDTQGLLDRTIVKPLMRMIDPALADAYVQDSGSVTEREVDEAMTDLSKMLVGLEPRMRERGVNHQLRLQTIQQALQASPRAQAIVAEDPDGVGKIVQTHLQSLEFQVMQEQNKAIGRTGARPATQGPAN